MLTVTPRPYTGKGSPGDFGMMVAAGIPSDTLLLYNSNCISDLTGLATANLMGTAGHCHRLTYRFETHPKAVAIPTGYSVILTGFDANVLLFP